MSAARAAVLLPALLFLFAPALARAADDDELEPADKIEETAPKKAPKEKRAVAADEDKPVPVEQPKAQPSSQPRASFPRISDPDETIFAVQRKAYLLDHRFELTVMGAASFTDRFVSTFAPAISVTYHLAENFGVELSGAYMFPSRSGLTSEIGSDMLRLSPETAKLAQLLWAAGLGAQWSPIYGKLEVLGSSLGNFNFYVSVGAGIGQSRVECTSGKRLDPAAFGAMATCPMPAAQAAGSALEVVYEPNTTHLLGVLGGGFRFYFSNSIGLKIEVKDWVYPSRVYRPDATTGQTYTDAIRNELLIQAGLSFLFGGKED